MIVENKMGPMIVHSNNVVGRRRRRPDWSEMFPELLVAIAIRLPSMEDFVAFRGVCRPWRTAASKDTLSERFKGLSKLPFLMLAEKDGGGSDDRQLYSLSRNEVWTTMSFPWFRNKRCMDVGFGWVLTVAAQGLEVSLVKPFTGAEIGLPNLTTFPGYFQNRFPVCECMYMRRGILSADPSRTSDFVLTVLAPTSGLGYWRPGETKWRINSLPCGLYWNIGYYKGRIVDIGYSGNVYMRNPLADHTRPDFIVKVDLRNETLNGMKPYIVESSSGELLLILRDSFEYGFDTDQFQVVRIDVAKGAYEIMEGGIGKDAIFLGENAAVCVDAGDFPGVLKPNCLYFTDDCLESFWNPNATQGTYLDDDDDCLESFWNPNATQGTYLDDDEGGVGGAGRDMGIYNFEDGSIQRFDVEESLSYLSPPIWIFPSF